MPKMLRRIKRIFKDEGPTKTRHLRYPSLIWYQTNQDPLFIFVVGVILVFIVYAFLAAEGYVGVPSMFTATRSRQAYAEPTHRAIAKPAQDHASLEHDITATKSASMASLPRFNAGALAAGQSIEFANPHTLINYDDPSGYAKSGLAFDDSYPIGSTKKLKFTATHGFRFSLQIDGPLQFPGEVPTPGSFLGNQHLYQVVKANARYREYIIVARPPFTAAERSKMVTPQDYIVSCTMDAVGKVTLTFKVFTIDGRDNLVGPLRSVHQFWIGTPPK